MHMVGSPEVVLGQSVKFLLLLPQVAPLPADVLGVLSPPLPPRLTTGVRLIVYSRSPKLSKRQT